jgi:DNA-binding transcriptional LysR family regulator
MNRLTAMTSFVKVVENAGFSAAARRLDLSTSVVTMHVKSLEDRLGVLLLNRSTRNVSPTEVGQAYYERCLQILGEIDEADEIAQSSRLKPRGVLRLNVAQPIPAVIAAPLAKFVSLYPDVSVRMTVTSRTVDLIEEGYDLAIRIAPPSDSRLIIRRLAAYRMVVCGAPSYFAQRGRPEQPADLARHNCLLFYDSPWGKEWRFAGPNGEETVRVSGDLETNSIVALRQAAVLGQGLICAPGFMVDAELSTGQLVAVLAASLPFELSIDALYPSRRYVAAKVRSFIDALAKHFHQSASIAARPLDAA